VTNQQTFKTNDDLGRLQENARIAFEQMARDVRQAGGNPCGTPLISNVLLNPTTDWKYDWAAGIVQGFNGAQAATGIVATGTATAQRVAGTDALKVLSGALNDGIIITNHDQALAKFTLNTVNHGISTGDIVMACDPNSAAITQITSANPGVTNELEHLDAIGAPSNCSKGLGFPEDCSSATGNPKTVEPGGFVTRLSTSTWYVGYNGRGGKSLYRTDGSGPQEIAEGVVDMQLQYLLRTTATNALGTNWVDATAVASWANNAADLVVAVKLTLTLQTLTNLGTDGQPITRQLIHVASIRNRSE